MATEEEKNLVRKESLILDSIQNSIKNAEANISAMATRAEAQEAMVKKLKGAFNISERELTPDQKPIDAISSVKNGGGKSIKSS